MLLVFFSFLRQSRGQVAAMIRNVRFENSFHVAVHGMSEFKHSILVQRRMESFRFFAEDIE